MLQLTDDEKKKEKESPTAREMPKVVLQLTKRPKKTSNNVKLDDLFSSKVKYDVPTRKDLLKGDL